MSTSLVFDREAVMVRIDHDQEFFRELFQYFCGDYPGIVQKLRELADKADAPGVERAAHSIKSALGNLGAMQSYERALLIEKQARAGELGGVLDKIAELEIEIEKFKREAQEGFKS